MLEDVRAKDDLMREQPTWFESQFDAEAPPGIPEPGGPIDAATVVIGAAFSLLRLDGHIDEAGRQQTLRALDVLPRTSL